MLERVTALLVKEYEDASFYWEVLELLRLMCEGHHVEMQEYIRTQPHQVTSHDLVTEVYLFLLALEPELDGTNVDQATCSRSAAVEWLALSFADMIVGRATDVGGGAVAWHAVGDYPLSSYTRYAAVFGLLPGTFLAKPGANPSCIYKSNIDLQHTTMGNWQCH